MDRESALDLLRQNHTFPGAYEFRVVVRPESVSSAVSAMAAVHEDTAAVEDVRRRESRKGNYVALKVRMRVNSAEVVLDVYEILNHLEGVVTTM